MDSDPDKPTPSPVAHDQGLADAATENDQVHFGSISNKEDPEELYRMKPNNILLFTILNAKYPITVNLLHGICSTYGQVERIVVLKTNEVQGMVEFKSVMSAYRVKDTLNGRDMYRGCCTMMIQFAKPDKLNVLRNDEDSWDYTNPNLGAMPRLTKVQRLQIITLRDAGRTWNEISAQLEVNGPVCTKRSMQRLYKKYKATKSLADLRGRGRNKSTSNRLDRIIRRVCLGDRRLTLNQIRSKVRETTRKSVSRMTISRRLRACGLKSYIPLRKPHLNKRQRMKRYRWALQHRQWKTTRWNQVLFSDESMFKAYNNRRHYRVRRFKNEAYSKRCLQFTVKNPPQVQVWGVMSSKGVGILKKVKGNLNSVRYQTEIINDLKVQAECLIFPDKQYIFQQDNAPAHASKSTRNFLQSKGIEILEWPSNSPDLSPIENLWDDLKKKVATDSPKSSTELWNSVKKYWYGIDRKQCELLYESLPRRIQAVVKARGASTKY